MAEQFLYLLVLDSREDYVAGQFLKIIILDSREDYVAGQFLKPPVKVPWKAIIYAFILFAFGTVLLTVGCLIGRYHFYTVI